VGDVVAPAIISVKQNLSSTRIPLCEHFFRDAQTRCAEVRIPAELTEDVDAGSRADSSGTF
jgi:hypothetical protein